MAIDRRNVTIRYKSPNNLRNNSAHVTLAPGYDEWREGAVQTLADCGNILEDRETFEIHLDRHPGAVDELRSLSAWIESNLQDDDAEIQRRRQQQERQQRQEQQKQEQQKQEQQEEEQKRKQERRQSMTRDRGGLSM